MNNYLVQQLQISGQPIQGPLQSPLNNQPINTLADVINILLTFLVPLAAIILFFVLVLGGYQFMFSQGNPEKVKSARAKITTGIIGFILLILSYFITSFVASIFGL